MYQETITTNNNDTVAYTAEIEGISIENDSLPRLNNIAFNIKHPAITNTLTITNTIKKKQRINIGLQAGYGYGFKSKQIEPYIGVGINFNF